MKRKRDVEPESELPPVPRKEGKKNLAKERLKKRLTTLRRKIGQAEKRIQKNKKARVTGLMRLVTEYNQTLELIYGEKGARVVPNLRVRNRIVEVFVPSIEEGKQTGFKRRTSPEVSITRVYTAEDGDLGQFAGFDSDEVMGNLQDDIDWLEAVEDRLENGDEYEVYSIQPHEEVKPGEVMFAVYDMDGRAEFVVTTSLGYNPREQKKNPIGFLMELAVDLFYKGYEVMFFVSQFDFDNGLIFPQNFDDDSDSFYDGGNDPEDPPSFSFS